MTTIHTSSTAAQTVKQPGEKTITVSLRNPARELAVNVNNAVFNRLSNETANPWTDILLSAAEKACEAIIRRYYLNTWDTHKITVSEVPDNLLSSDAIIEEMQGAATAWPTKEEFTEQWKASATRARIFSQEKYTANRAYRVAYTRYEELVLKLVGKTSVYQASDLDVILAKMDEADMETPFGAFILRRVEALKNKPAAADVDMDCL